jgi:YggT family protein
MLLSLLGVLDFLLQLLRVVIIVQFILSLLVAFNVINTYNDFVRAFLNALNTICEPLYRPIRRILPDFGGLDFSPLVVLILITILRMLLGGVMLDVASSYGA